MDFNKLQITSHSMDLPQAGIEGRKYIEVCWTGRNDNPSLAVFLELDEAADFIQQLSAVVFAAKAGVISGYPDDEDDDDDDYDDDDDED